MTVEELIEKLKEMPQNAEVYVQYRDAGGYYSGCDSEIYLDIEDNGKKVIL